MIWVVLGLFLAVTFGQAIWNDIACSRRERREHRGTGGKRTGMDFAPVASEPPMRRDDAPGNEAPADYDG